MNFKKWLILGNVFIIILFFVTIVWAIPCSDCGKENVGRSKFCGFCGAAIKGKEIKFENTEKKTTTENSITSTLPKQNIVNVKIGLDMSGKHKISAEGDSLEEEVNQGTSISGEYLISINKNMEIGAGITYQIPRSQKTYLGDFSFTPIYGLVKLNSVSNDTTLYVLGQFGINSYTGDSKYAGTGGSLTGGTYYGGGGGIVFNKKFIIEALYSMNKGSYQVTVSGYRFKFEVEYSIISLFIGFLF